MNLIGPLTETPRGNKYIITLTDYFSKWAEATALPDKTADGVTRFMNSACEFYKLGIWPLFNLLSRQTICRFGALEVVITDQGRE